MNDLDLYLHVREKEGRIYSDEIAAHLPDVPIGHPLASEWRARADSAKRLEHYLERFSAPLHVLELGCGNGWLSHHIASISGVKVWALDRGGPELTQAARLFGSSNLAFLTADIFQASFPKHCFDVIVLASVIQYFPNLPVLIQILRGLLTQRGEIHLIDSPLYNENEIDPACARTRAYYAELGFPEMAEHYFHHTVAALDEFSPRWLYHPSIWRSRLGRRLGQARSPFPWLCIR